MRILALIALVLACVTSSAPAAVIAVTGDFGAGGTGSDDVARLMGSWQPDAIILAGDNYYASVGAAPGTRYDASVGRYLCSYLRGAPPGAWCPSGGTAAQSLLWPVVGNHDYDDAGIAEYDAYFGADRRYYRTGMGPLDVFVLDSQAMRTTPAAAAEQGAWLKAALAESTATWKVVVVHHPPYVTSARGASEVMRLPYEEWGADAVLAGHDHYYERLQVGRVPYVVVGTGGASLSAFPATPVPESVAHHSGLHGALRIAVSSTTLAASYVTVDGVTRDAFMITAPAPYSSPPDAASPAPGDDAVQAIGNIRIRRGQGIDLALRRAAPQNAQSLRVAITLADRRGSTRLRAVRVVTVRPGQMRVRISPPLPPSVRATMRAQIAITSPRGVRVRTVDWVRVR